MSIEIGKLQIAVRELNEELEMIKKLIENISLNNSLNEKKISEIGDTVCHKLQSYEDKIDSINLDSINDYIKETNSKILSKVKENIVKDVESQVRNLDEEMIKINSETIGKKVGEINVSLEQLVDGILQPVCNSIFKVLKESLGEKRTNDLNPVITVINNPFGNKFVLIWDFKKEKMSISHSRKHNRVLKKLRITTEDEREKNINLNQKL